ncbi:MAG: sulfatase-like hydrolase/transferase, partial [Tagaea sp.]|nr:sulfatase-like hydrolase/transferase [Tagaea sp.]
FERHRAVSAWTGANVVALLSGVSPVAHGVHTRGQTIPEAWETPLDDLTHAGYAVAGLQGFMGVAGFASLGLALDTRIDLDNWLRARAEDKRPFFVWYHHPHTHLPYAPLPPYAPDWKALLPPGDDAAIDRVRHVTELPAIHAGSVDFQASDLPAIRALYDANFRAFDDRFAGLMAQLRATGLDKTTIVVLSSDHGEELLDRGPRVGHASTTLEGHLHEEIVRVPLILWLPPGLRAGPARVTAATDHLDLMPTLMRLLKMRPSRPLAGRDLFAPRGPDSWTGLTSKAGFSEPDPNDLPVWHAARLEGNWKLHVRLERGQAVTTALYDLAADPSERDDRAAARPDIVARLAPALIAQARAVRLDKPRPEILLDVPAPVLLWPDRGGAWRHADLGGRFALEWDGLAHAGYVVQYEAGSGALALAGTMRATGTRLALDQVDRVYWDTFVAPYGRLRLRVGVAGREDRWSDWREIELAR